jgi:hypothetical protein
LATLYNIKELRAKKFRNEGFSEITQATPVEINFNRPRLGFLRQSVSILAAFQTTSTSTEDAAEKLKCPENVSYK